MIPVVDAYAKYHKSVLFDDEMLITPRLVKFNGALMEYNYTIRFCSDDTIAATGHTAHCFVGEDFKPITIRKKYPDFYNRLISVLTKE